MLHVDILNKAGSLRENNGHRALTEMRATIVGQQVVMENMQKEGILILPENGVLQGRWRLKDSKKHEEERQKQR